MSVTIKKKKKKPNEVICVTENIYLIEKEKKNRSENNGETQGT